MSPVERATSLGRCRDGLAATAAQVPYLLSRVVSLAGPHGAVGLSEPYQSVEDLFDVRDVSKDYSYSNLRDKGLPPDVFGRGGFAPETSEQNEEPVFRARLSLVEGGSVLGVAVHHSTTDITGLGALLKIWAANCRRLRGSSDEGNGVPPSEMGEGFVSAAMLDRAAVRDLGSEVVGTEIPSTMPSVIFFQDGEPVPKPTAVTPPPEPASVCRGRRTWVSTGDVLTALLWNAVVAAEAPPPSSTSDNNNATSSSTISIPVNFRTRCEPPLPPDYLGAAFGRAAASAPVRELVSMAARSPPTMMTTSKAIRDQVNAQSIRAAVAYAAAQPDIARVKRRPADGISMVSWADQGVCALDWGSHVERCEAVRLGKMPGRRHPIVLPRLADGGLEVILSLEVAAMGRFRRMRW
ncbi:hypothetical protein PG994_012831 [Apiospora phragmitis]|uniref:Trichothecene 3-O-acetyltransferase-like N-terminal domain-containing protein n=1 Tax=Apiospora phragmitis TaxID=2905665 RepID=A0ABR1T9F2_9PEZI